LRNACLTFIFCSVKHRPHQVAVSFQHQSPAYLDEDYPIKVKVINVDDKDLEISLDVLLQPVDVDGASE
jgi:hypothetical protein